MGLFHSKSKAEGISKFSQADNVGTLFTSEGQANAYWVARTAGQKFEPFLLYEFDTINDAINGITGNDFIHTCKDVALICTEAFVFGIYDNERDKYEVIIAGWDMTKGQWKQARKSLEKNGGKLLKEQEPGNEKSKEIVKTEISKVTYQSTDKNGPNTYEVYSGPDAETAKEFLKSKPVTESLYYVIVETPEGNYGRDKDGIYKE